MPKSMFSVVKNDPQSDMRRLLLFRTKSLEKAVKVAKKKAKQDNNAFRQMHIEKCAEKACSLKKRVFCPCDKRKCKKLHEDQVEGNECYVGNYILKKRKVDDYKMWWTSLDAPFDDSELKAAWATDSSNGEGGYAILVWDNISSRNFANPKK